MPKHSPNGRTSDADDRIGLTEAFSPVPAGKGAHAGGFSYQGDTDDEYPDALDSLEPADRSDDAPVEVPAAPRGRHGKRGRDVPPHLRKSRRMRKILIVVIILLVALLAALGYFGMQWFLESQRVAVQQTHDQQGTQDADALAAQDEKAKDAQDSVAKKTEVPNLAAVLGLDQAAAITHLEHGATITNSRTVNEEGNPIKTSVTVALTDEPADTRAGTPTVYLGLDEEGLVVQAGYSTSTSSLGYGSLSFTDAVRNERIVEKTLKEGGITVPANSAELPADKMAYSTYASDGTTLVKENYQFTGTAAINGAEHQWSSVLQYDYTVANTSGNLADTIRVIYIYVNA